VRADRLVSLALLLQARGRMTAVALAAELEVSVRTVYRDLAALSAAGVPVVTESGPHGGCWLVDGYRFPLRGLASDEAEALLILGVPSVLAELGLADVASAGQRKISRTVPVTSVGPALVHLDMPAWFRAAERVTHLRMVALAVRQGKRLRIGYERGGALVSRTLDPLGLVNKSGAWYLVARVPDGGEVRVYRVARIRSAEVLAVALDRPAGFDLARFWSAWSAEFEASLPRIAVRVRAAPAALAVFPEVFGEAVRPLLEAAGEPDADGWREVALSFEHELAAAHGLAGFGGLVEVLSPPSLRDRLRAAAQEMVRLYAPAVLRGEGPRALGG
jgi:predicted DNA-binding transcriptional regulator YafY